MKEKILLGIETLDNVFSGGIAVPDITTVKPMMFNGGPAKEKPSCLIHQMIQQAKKVGYTVTHNGKVLKDEE
jgi:hypothetical protein